MIQKLGLYFFLGILTLGISYSFFVENIASLTFSVYYPLSMIEQDLNNEVKTISYCKENFKINQFDTTYNQRVFTVLENMVTGPTDIFLPPLINTDLSIKRVLIYGDLLVIDFNQFLLKLSSSEEIRLMQAFAQTIEHNFPGFKEFKWLTNGRNFSYINGNYRYQENFTLSQIKSRLAADKHVAIPTPQISTKPLISLCSNVS